jgi:hypothetical protein
LHLIDESRRKRQTDGILYAVSPTDIIDMMARYHVTQIQFDETKNRYTLHTERAENERYVGSCRVFHL